MKRVLAPEDAVRPSGPEPERRPVRRIVGVPVTVNRLRPLGTAGDRAFPDARRG